MIPKTPWSGTSFTLPGININNIVHLATHSTPDAVVAYHGALQFHGKAHSLSRREPFLTATTPSCDLPAARARKDHLHRPQKFIQLI